jgi:hypothetical protein
MKTRESDVELRNSAIGEDLLDGTKKTTKSTSNNLRKLFIAGITISGLFFIAIIVTYFLLYKTIDTQIKAVSEVSPFLSPSVLISPDLPFTPSDL